jgi:hypothetical protein
MVKPMKGRKVITLQMSEYRWRILRSMYCKEIWKLQNYFNGAKYTFSAFILTLIPNNSFLILYMG